MANTTTDRRQHDRTEVSLSATVERVGGRPLADTASTVDLSEGGARLLGPAAFAVGDVVRVTITSGDLAIERQALIVGRTASTGKKATLNVAFKSPESSDIDELRRLLAAG